MRVSDLSGAIPFTPSNLEAAKTFVIQKWKERAAERGSREPDDLSGACKFSSLFIQKLFGGTIEGNWHHQYNVIGGEVVDITSDSSEVGGLDEPYHHDLVFFGNPDHIESMKSCLPRVNRWVDEFLGDFINVKR